MLDFDVWNTHEQALGADWEHIRRLFLEGLTPVPAELSQS